MKLNFFLTVTTLGIHCSCILASQTNSGWGREANNCEDLIREVAAEGQESPECLAMLDAAILAESLDANQILEAAIKKCNSCLRHALWKMTGVLISVPTEDGESVNLTPLSFDKESHIVTIGDKIVHLDDPDVPKGVCLHFLMSYFWEQGWFIPGNDLDERFMLKLYTGYILAADSPGLLDQLFAKASQTPGHVINRINLDFCDRYRCSTYKLKNLFIMGIIMHDAVEIYSHLLDIKQLYPCNLRIQARLKIIFDCDAVKIFSKLQYSISVYDLDYLFKHEKINILTFSLTRGVHLSRDDARKIFGNMIFMIGPNVIATCGVKLNSYIVEIEITANPEGVILKLFNVIRL